MINDYINISAIETHLDKVIRANICKKCYAGTLPSTLTESVQTYVVIDCGATIADLHAYGTGIVNIYLYAQPAKGVKNVPALSKLEKAFSKALREDAFDSEHYSVPRNVEYSDTGFDNTYGMHYIIKAIRLTVI